MNLYVGNLNYQTTDEQLRNFFETHGKVNSVKIIFDRETQRPKGFGFVDMPDDEDAQKAIEALNGAEVGGRPIVVNEARPKPQGGGGGGGGRPHSGGGGRDDRQSQGQGRGGPRRNQNY